MARRPNNPEKELKVQWSKRENDLVIFYPSKPDGHLIHGLLNVNRLEMRYGDLESGDIEVGKLEKRSAKVVFSKSFMKELEDRGYDITTLKFTVKKKDVDED